MDHSKGRQRIGIYGGTFDPVHYGHLRCAWEVVEALGLDRLLMIPAGSPALRNQPGAPALARLQMLQQALAFPDSQVSKIIADDREICRQGTSYTYDTVTAIRQSHPDSSLWLIVGEDAFSRFDQWHRWEDILKFTNLVIVPRPGFTGDRSDAVVDLVNAHRIELDASLDVMAGAVVELYITPLAISATRIRELVATGRKPVFLTPATVIEFITAHSLYEKGVQ